MKDVFIYDTLRTPRGKGTKAGALYEVKPVDLIATALRALQVRNDLATENVTDAIIGCATPVDGQGYNIAKSGLLKAGWADSVSGLQINRYCTSGLEAVNLAALNVGAGAAHLIVAGGVESMSQVPIGTDGGALIQDPETINQIKYLPQGVAADLISSLEGFLRKDLDAYAEQSYERAQHALKNGYFNKSIVPVYDRNSLPILEYDEYLNTTTIAPSLDSFPTAFDKDGEMGYDVLAMRKYPILGEINHVHTLGNSFSAADGAALVLLGDQSVGHSMGWKPRAKIISFAIGSIEPTIMLTGMIPATEKALKLAGMTAKDIDIWECNENFAAVVLKYHRTFDIDPAKLNVNGGAIALGHPLGATGAILLGTILDELERRDLNVGLVTLSGGAGMGVATIIERV
ncbi:MAG: acetyl-CoA C-acetyltransferase [Saprospiraceae bacterium]|nr:acetyl-CoA C-acetyltransferase [Saprospiraceae bacterium]